MRKSSSTEGLQNLEPLVKMYQDTQDDRYFSLILESCRGYIQGAASRDALKNGIDPCDCESSHCMAVYKAAQKFDPSRNIPFGAFVVVFMKKGISDILYRADRKNSTYSPKNNKVDENGNRVVELVYFLAEENWDMVDHSPIADVANFVDDDLAIKGLVETISKTDKVAADAAVLVARGYSQREAATALGYTPVGAAKCAQNRWIDRKLAKCIAPTELHYKKMGIPIPIKLR